MRMKQYDLFPFEYILQYDDATAIDLTGATVSLTMWLDGASTPIVDSQACSVITPASGLIRYQWKSAETSTCGMFRLEFLITFTSGATLTVPSGDIIWMLILPSLNVVVTP